VCSDSVVPILLGQPGRGDAKYCSTSLTSCASVAGHERGGFAGTATLKDVALQVKGVGNTPRIGWGEFGREGDRGVLYRGVAHAEESAVLETSSRSRDVVSEGLIADDKSHWGLDGL
jgi:hypothetical protein